MADVHLPLFDTILGVFDTNNTPVPLPSASVALARSRGGLIGPYLQLLATLVEVKANSGATIGQLFWELPRKCLSSSSCLPIVRTESNASLMRVFYQHQQATMKIIHSPN